MCDDTDDKKSSLVCYYYEGHPFNIQGDKDLHNSLQNDINYASEFFQQLLNNRDEEKLNDHEQSNNSMQDDEMMETILKVEPSQSSNTEDGENVLKQKERRVYTDMLHTENWEDSSVEFLLNEYFLRKDKFKDPKYKKRNLWCEIALEFEKINKRVSFHDVSKKFANMKTFYCKIKNSNTKITKGTRRKTWQWLPQMDDIFGDDPSIKFSSNVKSMPYENEEPVNLATQSTSEHNYHENSDEASSFKIIPDKNKYTMSPNRFKSAKAKHLYYRRQKDIDLEYLKIDVMKKLVKKLDENKNIQNQQMEIWDQRLSELTAIFKEQNAILRRISNKLPNS